MTQKSLIIPQLRRTINPPFAWIDRRFLFHGFFAELTPDELLLYFLLVLVADRDGLSYYSYDNICQLLKMEVDSYIQARNGLIRKKLIACDSPLFQVLALPEHHPGPQPGKQSPPNSHHSEFQALTSILQQLGNQRL